MSFKNSILAFAALCIAACLSAAPLQGGESGLVSTTELMPAVASIDGIRIVPATDMPGKRYTEDHAPSQVVEIIRPEQGPISVGRLATSCTCLSAIMTKRDFAQGERVFIEIRNVKPTVAGGATYALFAQLNSPYRAALQYEIFVKSESAPSTAPAPEATPE